MWTPLLDRSLYINQESGGLLTSSEYHMQGSEKNNEGSPPRQAFNSEAFHRNSIHLRNERMHKIVPGQEMAGGTRLSRVLEHRVTSIGAPGSSALEETVVYQSPCTKGFHLLRIRSYGDALPMNFKLWA